MKVTVTGGRGFIGSHFVSAALNKGWRVHDIDKMGYASHRCLPWDKDANYSLTHGNIANIRHIPTCDILINFAAESHVDNSITNCAPFIESNVNGVHNLLELVRVTPKYKRPLFFHISTDEVYGDIEEGSFKETDKLNPSNPYSATKACSEMLINSYHRTYGIEYVMTRSGNNYGPRQYEEKLIAKCISCLKSGDKIPVHGDGSYIRDWTHVEDNVEAILSIIKKKIKNECFNIAANNYIKNIEVVKAIIKKFNKTEDEIQFVEDRWGQDIRYSVDTSKITKSTGWKPKYFYGLNLDFIDEKL
jgi:dTDP-glucose 4,6-dehydratase